MQRSHVVLVLVGVALGAVGVASGRAVSEAPAAIHSQNAGSLGAQVEALREETAGLRSLLQGLDERTEKLGARLAGVTQLPMAHGALVPAEQQSEPVERQTISPRLADERAEPARDAPEVSPVASLDAVVASEAADEDWAWATESAVLDAFEQAGVPDDVFEYVDCQRSLCRLEFAPPASREGPELVALLHTTEPFDGEFYAEEIEADDGTLRTVVYLARPGEGLPPVE